MEFIKTKLSDSFGVTIEPGSFSSPLEIKRETLESLFKTHRALYFKGWDLNLESFQGLSSRLCNNFSSYEGGGFRFKQLDRAFVNSDKTIMTTTGSTQGFPIPLHGEMHYMGVPPETIWFYCKIPGVNTGQTTLCDGHALANELPDHVKSFFGDRKIKYIRQLPDGAWQSSFMTESPEHAMEICNDQKVFFQFDKENNAFLTEYSVSPFKQLNDTNEMSYINNILNISAVEWAFESGWAEKELGLQFGKHCPLVVRMEDGSKIPEDILDDIRKTAEALTINVEWNKGEVLMVDNMSIMHGRRESTSKVREVYVRMGDTNLNTIS